MNKGARVMDFIRYKDGQYERVVWRRNPKKHPEKYNVIKTPFQPSPEQYVALANSKYNELNLM